MKDFLWSTTFRKVVTISALALVLISIVSNIINPRSPQNAVPSDSASPSTTIEDGLVTIIGETSNGAGKVLFYSDSSTASYEINGKITTVVTEAQPCPSHEDNSPTSSPWVWVDVPTSDDPYSGEVLQVCDSSGNLKLYLQLD